MSSLILQSKGLDFVLGKAIHLGMLQSLPEIKGAAEFVLNIIKPINILEIGVWSGGTFYVWCQCASGNGKKVCIDIAYSTYPGLMRQFSDNVFPLEMDSTSPETLGVVTEIMEGEQFDFAFIDGDHSLDGCCNDLRFVWPLVKDGGWIGFHDINDSETHRCAGCFVAVIWDGIKNELPTVEFNNHETVLNGVYHGLWGGIGFLKKVKNVELDLLLTRNVYSRA